MDEKNNPLNLLHTCRGVMEGCYGPTVQALGIILFVLIFNFFVRILLNHLSERFKKSNKIWSYSFVNALQKPFNYFVWFVAVIVFSDILLTALFNYRLYDMHMILSLGSILTLSWFLFRWNKRVAQRMVEMSLHHEIDMTLGKVDLISKIGKGIIIFITLFLLMDITGRNVQTLIAFGGIGGLALAFASQQVISNFFGGMMVYFTQPFAVGELINLPEKKIEGHIEEIGWYLTRIRSLEKRPIYVPNSIFSQTIVITPSRQTHERIFHVIKLRYEDIQIIEAIIKEIRLMLLQSSFIDQSLAIDVHFTGFAESDLNIEISAYVSKNSGKDFRSARQEVFLKIGEIIKQSGAAVATPTSILEIQRPPRITGPQGDNKPG
jgi:MscS family membrane protein